MAWHQTGRASVSERAPSAFGTCQRCGFLYNRRDLTWQYQWQGLQLQNIRVLVCRQTCYDTPQPQLKTIIIPPDPIPIQFPSPEFYDAEVPNFLMTESRSGLLTEDGQAILWEITDTPNPDPNNPALYP